MIYRFFDLKNKETCQRHDILLTPHNLLCGVDNDQILSACIKHATDTPMLRTYGTQEYDRLPHTPHCATLMRG